jgi:hypothetical protein
MEGGYDLIFNNEETGEKQFKQRAWGYLHYSIGIYKKKR